MCAARAATSASAAAARRAARTCRAVRCSAGRPDVRVVPDRGQDEEEPDQPHDGAPGGDAEARDERDGGPRAFSQAGQGEQTRSDPGKARDSNARKCQGEQNAGEDRNSEGIAPEVAQLIETNS